MAERPGFVGRWWMAIRPKTLSAAFAPVMVGGALAYYDGAYRLLPFLAALAGALLIQVATNLANDVMDYRRGADQATRVGPTRVTQAGLLSPRVVASGATACYAVAALIGLYLVAVAGTPVLILGAAAILSGVLYTAGPYPLAYVGLGDAFVLIFFGFAAVAGTYYVQALRATTASLALGAAIGALSVAILTANNMRDIASDAATGKRTFVVRMGARRSRWYYTLTIVVAFAVPILLWLDGQLPGASIALLVVAPLAAKPIRLVLGGAEDGALGPVLGLTVRLQVAHAVVLSSALIAARLVGV